MFLNRQHLFVRLCNKNRKMRAVMQHPQSSERNDSSKLKLLFHLGSWDYLPRRKKSGEKCGEYKVLTRDKERQRKTQIKRLHPKTSVSPS